MAEIIKDGPEVAILRYAVLAGLNSGTLCRNSAARWPDLVDKETGELDPEKVAKAGPLTAKSWRGLLAEVLVDPFDAGAEEAFALDFKALRKQAAEEMKAEAKATEPPAPTGKPQTPTQTRRPSDWGARPVLPVPAMTMAPARPRCAPVSAMYASESRRNMPYMRARWTSSSARSLIPVPARPMPTAHR